MDEFILVEAFNRHPVTFNVDRIENERNDVIDDDTPMAHGVQLKDIAHFGYERFYVIDKSVAEVKPVCHWAPGRGYDFLYYKQRERYACNYEFPRDHVPIIAHWFGVLKLENKDEVIVSLNDLSRIIKALEKNGRLINLNGEKCNKVKENKVEPLH